MLQPHSWQFRLIRRLEHRKGRDSHALGELDYKLRRFVRRRHGFFVEAGANDGVAQSNTLFFERYLGWRGLLVEPVPELAERCRRNRPACIVENTALVSSHYSKATIDMQFCNLMSIVDGARGSKEADLAHLRSGVTVQPNTEVYPLTVPASTLSAVLDRHRVTRIDLLSLDVEGFGLEVLDGLDLQRHAPRFILVETAKPEKIDQLLAGRYSRTAKLSVHDYLYSLAHKRQ